MEGQEKALPEITETKEPIDQVRNKSTFVAGQLKYFVYQWKTITNDPEILDIIRGYKLEFCQKPEYMRVKNQKFSKVDSEIISQEISKFLKQGIIVEVPYNKDIYLSPIFIVPKAKGFRLILNLKRLNEYIRQHHFKMETFEHALTLVSPNIYMSSLDLENAYYSISIAEEDRKFLSFEFKGKYYSYTCLPNGLSSGPYIFTRIMKPVFAEMRKKGFLNSIFIDDSFLLGNTKVICRNNVKLTKEELQRLGFSLNFVKSVEEPCQKLQHLGNVIDSKNMIVFLPDKRIEIIINECKNLTNKTVASIRLVARVVGLLVASLSAVEYGKLHYRTIERKKIEALKEAKGNFNSLMKIDVHMKVELRWWIKNVKYQSRVIERPPAELVITTDSSKSGWGCVYEGTVFNGRWTEDETNLHINTLELLAILFAVQALIPVIANKTVSILTDSSTAVSYVTNMGGIKSITCDKIARTIWNICIKHNIWIHCSHVPGSENIADEPSRKFNDRHEWSLCQKVFDELVHLWGLPDIDMFANRINTKLSLFCSWKPDPESTHVDAFTLNWKTYKFIYLFPPFSLLPRVLQKVRAEKVEAIVIAPLWTMQLWFPMLLRMIIDNPRILPPTAQILQLPQSEQSHPLAARMTLIGARISGKPMKAKAFQARLPTLSSTPGDLRQRSSINTIYRNGFHSVIGNKLIKFILL